MKDGEVRVPEDASEALLEFAGCSVPTQLDHQATGRRVSLLLQQLAGNETDGNNAVFLRGVQQPLAGALPCRVVLEGDLIEPGKRVPHVRLVVDRQPPRAARVDVGERAVRQAGPPAGVKPGHAPTIPRGPRARLRGREQFKKDEAQANYYRAKDIVGVSRAGRC